jgi:hypothetical protein
MGVSDDREIASTEAPYGPLEPRTATLLTLPISRHHTVRSVAQRAFKRLWTEEPDRAERWRRVGNMDEVFGVGRPLRTISKPVIAAAIREMQETAMPGPVIQQHLEDFRFLLTWAFQRGFVDWG